MTPRVVFPNKILPYLLVAPQLAITLVFFYWPAGQALYQSMLKEDPFGLKSKFVWFDNFAKVLSEPAYINALEVTVIFSVLTTIISMAVALLLAVMAEKIIFGRGFYRTLMIWPYAVAPAIAGMLFLFMFNPSIGSVAILLRRLGLAWDPVLDGTDAMILLVVAAAWKQISYNFLFFVAGLQAIPKSLIEAAAIDGVHPVKTFWKVTLPLCKPILVSCVILHVLFAWNEYLFAMIFTSGADLQTLPVGLTSIMAKHGTNYAVVFAAMTLSALPIVMVFFAAQRFFIRGLAEGIGK